MADLMKAIRSWAAGREGVSQLDILDIEYDFDEGWPGTDVTPGDLPEVVIQYKVQKHVIYKKPVAELGDFITELAAAMANRPALSSQEEQEYDVRASKKKLGHIEITVPGGGVVKGTVVLVSEERMAGGDDYVTLTLPSFMKQSRVCAALIALEGK